MPKPIQRDVVPESGRISFRTSSGTRVNSTDAAALRILASSIARELRSHGYGLHHIVGLASELIGFACKSIRRDRALPSDE